MNVREAGCRVLLAAAVFAAGCSPEKDCRDGIQQVRPRVEGAIGQGAHPQANEQISQAYVNVDEAERKLKAGDFQGCLAKLEEARVLLNKSQRE